MADEMVSAMNRTLGALTEAVIGLRRDIDNVLQYIKEQNAITDEHEGRLARLEDCQKRNTDNWKLLVGTLIIFVGGLVLAWAKKRMGL